MKKLLIVFINLVLLTGCSWLHVHKMDVEQGNLMTEQQINQLHTGMTVSQVKQIMGNPVIVTTFDDQRLNYVYTFKPGNGQFSEQYVILTFNKGILRDINQQKNLPAGGV